MTHKKSIVLKRDHIEMRPFTKRLYIKACRLYYIINVMFLYICTTSSLFTVTLFASHISIKSASSLEEYFWYSCLRVGTKIVYYTKTSSSWLGNDYVACIQNWIRIRAGKVRRQWLMQSTINKHCCYFKRYFHSVNLMLVSTVSLTPPRCLEIKRKMSKKVVLINLSTRANTDNLKK